MNNFNLVSAALDLGYDISFTIEADGTMWTGTDNNRTYVTAAQVTAIKKRATELETAKTAARQAVLDKLGLTADEAAALLG
jgi:hypothetical protein